MERKGGQGRTSGGVRAAVGKIKKGLDGSPRHSKEDEGAQRVEKARGGRGQGGEETQR